jgi:glucose-6-phosphate 1-dehydrogenase
MAAPLTIVIFGASGDLTARKLVPALYNLAAKKRLPPECQIVGVARSPLGDAAFRSRLGEAVRANSPAEWNTRAWEEFAQRVFYVAADAVTPAGLEHLRAWLTSHERDQGGSRRLFYLAVAPQLYADLVTRLDEAGMTKEDGGWRRVVIEKPFGRDLRSARELNRTLHAHLQEDQIYRIDHYLGKETVQNVLVFRFANSIFEPLWNHRYIDHVQITVSESVPVGRRGDYYDTAGVLRDMFQSHLLQLLALITMEPPARFAATPVRNEKIKVLESIPILQPERAARQMVCAHYAGYLSEPGVAPDSSTPTYAAVRLDIDNWRWQGVPFYLRSGKALARRSSEVIIQFRSVPHLMFALPRNHSLEGNRLALCIQPDEGIHLYFQSKVPDQEMSLRPANLEFHFSDIYAATALPEAYQRLLQDAIQGDATLFMRSDEIERAWEIMEPFISATEKPGAPKLESYAVGSEGPACADALLARDGRAWTTLCHTEESRKVPAKQ